MDPVTDVRSYLTLRRQLSPHRPPARIYTRRNVPATPLIVQQRLHFNVGLEASRPPVSISGMRIILKWVPEVEEFVSIVRLCIEIGFQKIKIIPPQDDVTWSNDEVFRRLFVAVFPIKCFASHLLSGNAASRTVDIRNL